MHSLKKIIIASTAALAMTGAAAGVAQAQPGRDYDRGYDHRFEERGPDHRGDRLSTGYVDSLNWKIQAAAREGRISWREAHRLQDDLNQVKPLAWRYQNAQARRWEIDRLEQTVDRISQEVRG